MNQHEALSESAGTYVCSSFIHDKFVILLQKIVLLTFNMYGQPFPKGLVLRFYRMRNRHSGESPSPPFPSHVIRKSWTYVPCDICPQLLLQGNRVVITKLLKAIPTSPYIPYKHCYSFAANILENQKKMTTFSITC